MLGSAGGTAEVWRCGIGAVECAARTAGVLAARRPDFILLAGIAGAHPSVGLAKGDTVMVSREYAADVGTLREGRFIPLPVDGNDVKNNFYDNPTSVPPLFPERSLGYGRRRGNIREGGERGLHREYGGSRFLRRMRCVGGAFRRAFAAYRIISARSAAVGGLRRRSEGLRRMSGGSSTPCGSGRKELPDGWAVFGTAERRFSNRQLDV